MTMRLASVLEVAANNAARAAKPLVIDTRLLVAIAEAPQDWRSRARTVPAPQHGNRGPDSRTPIPESAGLREEMGKPGGTLTIFLLQGGHRICENECCHAFLSISRQIMMEMLSFERLMVRLRPGDDDAAAVVFHAMPTARRPGVPTVRYLARRQGRPGGHHPVGVQEFLPAGERGQFEVDDWENLWSLLVVITLRKCGQRRDYLRAERRDAARRSPRGVAGGPQPVLGSDQP